MNKFQSHVSCEFPYAIAYNEIFNKESEFKDILSFSTKIEKTDDIEFLYKFVYDVMVMSLGGSGSDIRRSTRKGMDKHVSMYTIFARPVDNYYSPINFFFLEYCSYSSDGKANVVIRYNKTGASPKLLIEVEEFIDQFAREHEYNKNNQKHTYVNVITADQDGIDVDEYSINKVDIDIDTHYNDDFIPVHEKITAAIDNDSNGITLLHGIPGTGKTNYIRHLMGVIEKKCIYIPPSMASSIADPSFMTLMLQNKNSVLIIEDAENVLMARDPGNNQAVSNLLNLADGILGDLLSIQIICTFNCEMGDIDEAMLRPGRLLADYEFQKLSVNKSRELCATVGSSETDMEMTLAEIYNDSTQASANSVKFGFIPEGD